MTRRSYIRIVSYIMFGLVILIVTLVTNTSTMTSYKNQLELNYQQSLVELDECLDNVNTDLTKSLYSSSSGEIYDLSRDLFSQCSVAKNAVSRLPISQMELTNIYKFLSQASDYSQYIGAKIQKGETITDEEHKNLMALLDYAQKFSKSTAQMVSVVEGGARIVEGEVTSGADINISALSNSFSESANEFKDFPTLLYDGPFSDQILNKQSELVKNGSVKSKNECRDIAAKALGTTRMKMNFEADEQSKMPCYTFTCGRYTISVTKQGGYIKSILYSGIINDSSISEQNAINLGAKFLDSIGYKNMKESYYTISNNICTINYAYTENDVYYYSDLIKCSISMSDGKIVSLDAQTYLTNHIKRESFTATKTAEEYQKNISKYLTVNSKKKCVIPKENGSEIQCFEYSCTSKDTGEDALVYLNSKTGQEEDIMLLLKTDNGTLVK